MADQVLLIGWDEVTRGREERAVEVFGESVGYYGRLQQEGRIESFDAVFLQPNGSGLQGYFEIHGTGEQLGSVQMEQEFQKTMLNASLIVEALRIIPGYTNEGIASQMAMFQEAIAKVPQAH
jgi:hypothetical protein